MKKAGLGAVGLMLAGGGALGEEQAGAPRLRWGLLGTGRRCWQHIKLIQRFPETRIVALCDIRKERLDHALGICAADPPAAYDDYRELLKRDDLDLILVATPNHLHGEMVVAALSSGRHILAEKPMGITVAECNQIIEAARKNGKVMQVGLQLHYSPFYRRVHGLLNEGAIGRLKFVWFSEFRGDWVKQSDDPETDRKVNWRFYDKLSGGTLVEKSCHCFDLFRWLIGSVPRQVAATGGINFHHDGRDTLDHASVVIEFEDGVKATHGLSMYSPNLHSFVLIGEKGALDLNDSTGDILLRRAGKEPEVLRAEVGGKDTGGHPGTYELHQSFLECVRTGKPPLTDAVAGKESVRLALAAELAVKEKRWVSMSEIPA